MQLFGRRQRRPVEKCSEGHHWSTLDFDGLKIAVVNVDSLKSAAVNINLLASAMANLIIYFMSQMTFCGIYS